MAFSKNQILNPSVNPPTNMEHSLHKQAETIHCLMQKNEGTTEQKEQENIL